MRWTCCLTVMILSSALNSAVAEAGCGCRGAGGGPDYAALGADACCLPGYTLAPSCGDSQRHCCDNAWAGYCAHRAKVEAFWSRIGAPRPPRHGACGVPGDGYESQGDVQSLRPTPAAPATPAVPPPPTVPENFRSSRAGNLPMQQ